MSNDSETSGAGKAAIVGAIGSAAIAAALLYADHRRKREKKLARFTTPFNEQPETD